MIAITYLTRKCPRNCDYCGIVSPNMNELPDHKWIAVWKILEDMGVKFNLILGNDPWILGPKLLTIMGKHELPYGMYTSCYPDIFFKYWNIFFGSYKPINNLSCSIDYPPDHYGNVSYEVERKSRDGWFALKNTRKHYPDIDCQGTFTVTRENFDLMPETIEELTYYGIMCAIGFINYNRDGHFDFFADTDDLKHLLFRVKDIDPLWEVFKQVRGKDLLIRNPHVLERENLWKYLNMGWHCGGNPTGGPTIDADGSLRCCGYRKGTFTPEYSIFDLPKWEQDWQQAVFDDAHLCPGCNWTCARMYHHEKDDTERIKQYTRT